MKLKDYISSDTLKPFDYVMIAGVLLTSLAVNLIAESRGDSFDWLGFFAAVTGVIGNVLVARGNILNYYFGAANVILYAIIAFVTRYYGNAALNLLYYLPMQFVGWFSWKRAKDEEDPLKVKPRRLNWKNGIAILLVATALTFVVWYILVILKDGNPVMDAVSTVLSMTAMLMMVRLYAEQWYLWIIVNIITIAMWVAKIGEVRYAWMMIVMWSFYLVNSVNGLIQWLKKPRFEEVR